MSDSTATVTAITLENLNLRPGGPQRVTITADDTRFFERDTITERHPVYGVHESARWLPVRTLDTRNTTHRPAPMTPPQMMALAASMERMGWKEIGLAYHGLPDAGIVQR